MFVAALTFLLFVGLEAKPQWGSGEQSWDKNTKFENADDKYEMISHEVLESTDVSLPSLINKWPTYNCLIIIIMHCVGF